MTLGSLFDGSGGFPLAGALNGITPVWSSEVEPYPIAVTRSRFPNTKHYGNVCNIKGAEVEPVDIITFGSPCQDMSVAGKRAGMKHSDQGDNETTRSGLFYEAIRIIEEMRKATNGEYPKYAVWENVAGAFSSNKGHDFHAVLEAFCAICDSSVSIPEPVDPRNPDKLVWNGAGETVGSGYSVCWRTFDAQYWRVPQRRRRIYLVADFNSERAGEILFKFHGLRGDLPQGYEAREGAAVAAMGGVDGGAGVECLVLNDQGGSSINMERGDVAPTLRAQSHQHEPIITIHDQATRFNGKRGDSHDGKGNGLGVGFGAMNTLTEGDRHSVCYPLNEQVILRHNALGEGTGFGAGDDGDPAYTLQSAHPHMVCYAADCRNFALNRELSPTLQAKPGGGFSYNCISPIVYDARGNDDGEIVNTLTGDHQGRITDYTAVACFQNTGRGWWNQGEIGECIRTPAGGDSVKANLVVQDAYAIGNGQVNQPLITPQSGALNCMHDQQAILQVFKPPRRYIIRRLMPIECSRLQGFPDGWADLKPYDGDAEFWESVRKTHAEINGKKYKPAKDVGKWYNKLHNDGAEYKMWGNGIALPNAEYVIRGIKILEDLI